MKMEELGSSVEGRFSVASDGELSFYCRRIEERN
jgi:hypothetical protein